MSDDSNRKTPGSWISIDKVDMTTFYRFLEVIHNAKYDPDAHIPPDLEYLIEVADSLEGYDIEEDEK